MMKISLKKVRGYDDYYCNQEGEVYRRLPDGAFRQLKQHINDKGVQKVSLKFDTRKYKMVPVSRIILEAFKGSPPGPDYMAVHMNSDRNDNRAKNLEWRSLDEVNNLYRKSWRDKRDYNKLTKEDVEELVGLLNRHDHPSLNELAEKYGVSKSEIKHIKYGRVWRDITGGEIYNHKNKTNK